MARRKTARKPTRRKASKSINVLGVAESLILANATTRAAFGTNLIPFLTEGWLRPVTNTKTNYGSSNSWAFSANELFKYATGDRSHQSTEWQGKSFGDAIKMNFRANGVDSIMTMIAVPIAFRLGRQILSKPRREANKLLRMSGIGNVVKV